MMYGESYVRDTVLHLSLSSFDNDFSGIIVCFHALHCIFTASFSNFFYRKVMLYISVIATQTGCLCLLCLYLNTSSIFTGLFSI
ncbi:hypothetical protein GDO86_003503 [Hymenochirus boettgeri]|uniref:Uncharacterized protein n=1 Tax=Hymenochirus boettgeri TaxID=247094 RepID=A0A8T2K9W4_9PIPI|nr:hypothetical protein GDO86_003503 [Hymenochirus boettgeri]